MDRLPKHAMRVTVDEHANESDDTIITIDRVWDGAGVAMFVNPNYGQITGYWHPPGKNGGPQVFNIIINEDGTLDVSIVEG